MNNNQILRAQFLIKLIQLNKFLCLQKPPIINFITKLKIKVKLTLMKEFKVLNIRKSKNIFYISIKIKNIYIFFLLFSLI